MPLLYSVASAPDLLSLASFTLEPDWLTTRSAARARLSTNDRQSSRTCHSSVRRGWSARPFRPAL